MIIHTFVSRLFISILFLVTVLSLSEPSLLFAQASTEKKAPALENALKLLKSPPAKKAAPKKSINSKTRISKIIVKGNVVVPEQRILNELIIQVGEKHNPIKLNRSIKNVQSTGLFSQVRSQVSNTASGKVITLIVKENPLLRKIIFRGNTIFSSKELMEVVFSKEGELIDISLVRKDIQAIESLYKEQGYFMAKVIGVDKPKTTKDPLIFKLSEGILEEVIITGNTRTQEYVILREMDLKVGSAINEKTLKKDMQKIFNLNYFGKLNPSFEDGSKEGDYKLSLEIEEKSTGTFNFGGGYGRASGFFMYSDLYVDNLFGTGQLVALRGQFGRSNTYQFKYFNPWMWEDRKSLQFRLWYTTGQVGFSNVFDSGFRAERRHGFDLAIGIPFSYEWRSTHKIRNEDIYIPQDSSQATSEQDYSIRSYTFTLSYDSRDFRMNPRDGQFHTFSVEKGFKFKANSLEFMQVDATMNWFNEVRKNQVLALRLMAGQKLGDILSKESELYYVGGSNTVRGYPDFPDSFGRGGARLIGNVEYRFLFNDVFTALLFVDAGWASAGKNSSDSVYKIGKGFGARIMSPLGPIRLDFGIDENTEMIIHFNIGHIF